MMDKAMTEPWEEELRNAMIPKHWKKNDLGGEGFSRREYLSIVDGVERFIRRLLESAVNLTTN